MSDVKNIIGRIAGIDYGSKRIGIATSDVEQRIAVPSTTLNATGSFSADAAAILRWSVGNDVRGFVIGMPYNMDGSAGPQAQLTTEFMKVLQKAVAPLIVVPWDERLSSYQADEWLQEAGTRKSSNKRNPLRDALAATAILRSYLASLER